MAPPAMAETLDKPTLLREVLLGLPEQPPIKPWVAAKANDNAFIIAGSGGLSAWAARIDAEGNLVANYTFNLRDHPKGAHAAEFRGIVPMPDGTAYLCGRAPHKQGSDAGSALLVHIDAAGHLIDQKNLDVQGLVLEDCIRWGDGLAIVGQIGRVIQPAGQGRLPNNERSYYLAAIDAKGNMKWDKKISISTAFSTFSVGPLLATSDSGLVFSTSDNVNSELLRVSANGTLEVHKKLSGKFQFVRPVVPDNLLQVWGWSTNAPSGHVKMTLNKQLEEIGRVQQRRAVDYVARVAYRLPDQSLALFGSAVRDGSNTSVVVHVSPELEFDESFEPPRSRKPYLDSGSIWAAAPGPGVGEFVTARSLAILSGAENGTAPDFKRGAVLDFLRLN